MKQSLISFENYEFQYRAQAKPTLYNINLEIQQGEKVLVIGASGSGKSTIVNCLNGLIPFRYEGESSGSLFIDGKETKKQSIFQLSKIIGTVLQDLDGQFIGLTVGEDIAFAAENDCKVQKEMFSLVEDVAIKTNTKDLLESAPHELSGGQKQRVSLAGIMVDQVKIFLFDEPLANLDPATGKRTIELIDQIQKDTQATMVIIEHRLEDVLYKDVDRIILMSNGSVVANETTSALLASDLLVKYGIREPFYITALKYADVELVASMESANLDYLNLHEEQKKQVRNWFERFKKPIEVKRYEPLLQVKHIKFAYELNRFNLEDISFTVGKGEMISIVGKNGAGKSTISKLICGFEKASAGKILLEGIDLEPLTIRERAKKIGYVMQNPNQMISKNLIYDEIALGLMNSSMTLEEQEEQIEKVMKICGIYQFRKWPISALSFGQKKRVTIASVLVLNPEVIILDEPTAGQDFKHYTEIMEFLVELHHQGITIILVTHDMHLMLEYTTRTLVFADGSLLASTTPAELLCSEELTRLASLKQTSLFQLANICNIENPVEFVQRFIEYDREVRSRGK